MGAVYRFQLKQIIDFLEANVNGKTLDTKELVYELARRQSTGNITGLFRFISASGKDVAAEAIVSGIYDVVLEHDVLKLKEEQVLYRDQPIQDNHFKPVVFQSNHRFFVKDSKLNYEYEGQSFDIDTVTMQRKTSVDNIPLFVSVEK